MTSPSPAYRQLQFEQAGQDMDALTDTRRLALSLQHLATLRAEAANTDVARNCLRTVAAAIADHVLPELSAEMDNLTDLYGVSRDGACDQPEDKS